MTRSSARSTCVRILRAIGNIGSPLVGAGVCLQVVADRAASKHSGDFRNLGKAGPRADHTRRRTVDDTAVPEFGEERVLGGVVGRVLLSSRLVHPSRTRPARRVGQAQLPNLPLISLL